MNQVIEYLIEFGYSQLEAKQLVESYAICNFKEDTLLNKCKETNQYLIDLGYTKEEIIKMTKLQPTLYGLSIENIKIKIDYLREIGLEFIIIQDTKQLMQSVDLTYARYEYLKEIGYSISEDNYAKLFYNNKQFMNQFAIDKNELLKRYPYQNKKEGKIL